MQPRPTLLYSILLLLFFLSASSLKSQCLAVPSAPDCNSPGTLLADNETINLSTTRWFYGTAATYGDLKMNGGTLIVCGDLKIDRFVMDSGTIYVAAGAKLVIGNGIGYGIILRGNSAIYNYGTLEIQRNLSLDNGYATALKPNVVMNATASSVFKLSNQYLTINNPYSWFVNKGYAEAYGIITDPMSVAGSVCLGTGSETKMTLQISKVKNNYASPEGTACVSVSQFTQLYDTLTKDPTINLCLGATHRTDSSCIPWGCKPQAWGKANLVKPCTACSAITTLSISNADFTLQNAAKSVSLLLQTYLPGELKLTAERSTDAVNFIELKEAGFRQVQPNRFIAVDPSPKTGISYYRIRYYNEADKKISYSSIIKLTREIAPGIILFPNPFQYQLQLIINRQHQFVDASLYRADGKMVQAHIAALVTGSQVTLTPDQSLAKGMYLLKVITHENTMLFKVIKK